MRPLLVTLLLIVLGAAVPSAAHATSCKFLTLGEARAQQEVVFTARVLSVSPVAGGQLAVLRLKRVYKGEAPAMLRVKGGGLPGFHFQQGTRVVVFTKATTDPYVGMCSGTRRIDNGKPDLTALGPGKPPAAAGTPLGAGAEPMATATASAGPPPPPAETSTPTAQPTPPPEPPAAPPPALPPPAVPAPRGGGGCASCAIGASSRPSVWWGAWLGVVAALSVLRRSRGPSVVSRRGSNPAGVPLGQTAV